MRAGAVRCGRVRDRLPASPDGLRRVDLRLSQRGQLRNAAHFAGHVVGGGENLTTRGIHPDADARMRYEQSLERGGRERLERGDADDGPSRHHRHPLHGGEADAQPREGARPARDGEDVDVCQLHSSEPQYGLQLGGQAFAVGARRVAFGNGDDRVIAQDCGAAGASGRVEGQDEHE